MPPDSEPKAQPGESGDRLRSEVEILVSLECRKIARAMVRNTIKGNMSVARLLVDLTGARARKPRDLPVKKPRRGMTFAQRLAKQPDWKGPTEAEEDKMFAKTLEPAV